jgi:hypothetical protein
VRRAEPIAGLGGILLLGSLFLRWYGGAGFDPAVVDALPPGISIFGPADITAWQAFTVIDILLALIAVTAILVPVLSVATRGPAKSIGIAVIASAVGWIGVLLVVFRLIDMPTDDMRPLFPAWIGLAGAVIAWVGSWLSLRDESTPGAVVPDLPLRPIAA